MGISIDGALPDMAAACYQEDSTDPVCKYTDYWNRVPDFGEIGADTNTGVDLSPIPPGDILCADVGG